MECISLNCEFPVQQLCGLLFNCLFFSTYNQTPKNFAWVFFYLHTHTERLDNAQCQELNFKLCRKSGWKHLAALQIFFFFECLPICFLSHCCFLYIPKGIKLFLVSFQAFLLHTIWKPVSFSFHLIFVFLLLEWALQSHYSYSCNTYKNTYCE